MFSADPRIEFFNQISGKWDGWHDLDDLSVNLSGMFDKFGILPDETVVDVGCGTGNLSVALLSRLDESGKVIALDISPEMLKLAQDKCNDSRVSWFLTDATHIPVEDNSCDRVICFSAWPHFENPCAVIEEVRRILKPGGYCHILHFISRENVNAIHKDAHPSVTQDILLPAFQVASLFQSYDFVIEDTVDNEERYLISVQKNIYGDTVISDTEVDSTCESSSELIPSTQLITGISLLMVVLLSPVSNWLSILLPVLLTTGWSLRCRLPVSSFFRILSMASAMFAPLLILAPYTHYAGGASWMESIKTPLAIGLRGILCILVCTSTYTSLGLSKLGEALYSLPVPKTISVLILQILHQSTMLKKETTRMLAAYRLRGLTTAGFLLRLRCISAFPILWLMRLTTRAENIGDAMELRGYTGIVYSHPDEKQTPADIVVRLTALLIILMMIIIRITTEY